MENETIWVVVASEPLSTRGGAAKQLKQLKVEELSVSIHVFLEQMGSILATTPEQVGKFHFEEFEVSAEVTGKGTLALFGTGGEIGAAGGLKFVFRRAPASGRAS